MEPKMKTRVVASTSFNKALVRRRFDAAARGVGVSDRKSVV